MKKVYLIEKGLGRQHYQSGILTQKSEASSYSNIPNFCICCMKNADDIQEINFRIFKKTYNQRITHNLKAKFPICHKCKQCEKKNDTYVFLTNTLPIIFSIISALLMRNYGLIVFSSILVALVTYLLLSFLIKPSRTEDGFISYASVFVYKLYTGVPRVVFGFTNKNYAKFYSDINDLAINEIDIHGTEEAHNIWSMVQHPLRIFIEISVIVSVFAVIVYLWNIEW